MKIKITIDCSNAAFADAPLLEVARILDRLARQCENGAHVTYEQLGKLEPTRLSDINGNRVGEMKVTR